MRRILGDRRTFAAALVVMVLAAVLVGQLRDGDGASGSSEAPTPSISVSQSPSPSEDESPDDEETGPSFPTAVAPSAPPTDPDSGLPLVRLASLPPEAAETAEQIDAGGPFPYEGDGETFLNSAGLLPDREVGYYRVYTVESPGPADGPRRIVTGSEGELYWTDDRYESFSRVERGDTP